ncbi:hypothetical protein LS48_14560 [Aequorivita aquimaris]|uniref:Uncharacterized protein n=1 Tax=Aequorivita aquimaris TaxID=1548749 RepID=A0A137REC2_9FLAO|nr:hypothetical protein [Aequorivita aquimaris]KXN97848.1 hypothetical protein LS48_14560 [Aequorivita aquimaris]
MQTYLCTNCGVINLDNSTNYCVNCNSEFDEEKYKQLTEYAERATKYGYQYRVEYEHQVEKFGKVKSKYSLIDPSNYYQWLAAAALSGIVGTIAYDLVKFVAKQIYKTITSKKTEITDSDKQVLEFISNNAELIKFTNYIRQYYSGNAKIPKEALNAILEEELVHSLINNHKGEFNDVLKKMADDKSDEKPDLAKHFGALYLEAAKSAGKKRKDKPKLNELKESMKVLKKEIKKAKKDKRKRKK